MTKLEQKQFNLNILKKCRFSFSLSLVLVLTLALAKLILVNRSATWGRQLEAIEAETLAVKAETDQLKLQLNQQGGRLSEIKDKAFSLGYVEKPQYWYLPAGDSVAQKLP